MEGRKRQRRRGDAGYCPYCWQFFDRRRALEQHWREHVRSSPADGFCSARARDADTTKEDLDAYLDLVSRARFGVKGGAADGTATDDHGDGSGGSSALSDYGVGRPASNSLRGYQILAEDHSAGDTCPLGELVRDPADYDMEGMSDVGWDDRAGEEVGEGDADGFDNSESTGRSSKVASTFRRARDAGCESEESWGGGPGDDDFGQVRDPGYESPESWAGGGTDDEEFGQGSRDPGYESDFLGGGEGSDARDDEDEESRRDPEAPVEEGVNGGGSRSHDQQQTVIGNSRGAPGDIDSSSLPPPEDPRWLHNLHRKVGEQLGARVMEGGRGKTKRRQFGKKNQDYRPFKSVTELLLFVFGVKHQISGAGMKDLFDILRFVDGQPGDGAGEGRGFDRADVPNNGGEKFISRMREFLPLFEVWSRDTLGKPEKKKSGGRATAKVFDIPITQVLAFLLKSRPHMEAIFANPGGAVVGKEEGEQIGLSSEHLLSIPTRPVRNARRNNMHGTLVQAMPQHNTDGFLSMAGTKLYVGDVAMCDLRPTGSLTPLQVPCRVTRTVFDAESRKLVVYVRRFRNANEVLGIPHSDPHFAEQGLVRAWEEVGTASEMDLRDVQQVLDRIEVFTKVEMKDGAHRRPWNGPGTRREGWSFVGEGFVSWRGGRFVKLRNRFMAKGWRRAGSDEEAYPDMRSPDVNHNTLNLKFLNLPIALFADDFNAFNYSTPVSHAFCGD